MIRSPILVGRAGNTEKARGRRGPLCPHRTATLPLLLAPVFLPSLSLTHLFSHSLSSQKILVFRFLAELLTILCIIIALCFTLSLLPSPDLVLSC